MLQQVGYNHHTSQTLPRSESISRSAHCNLAPNSFSDEFIKARTHFHQGNAIQPEEPQIRYDAQGIPFLEDVCIQIDRLSMIAMPVCMMDEANRLLEEEDYMGYVEMLAKMGIKPLPIPMIAREFDLDYVVDSLAPPYYYFTAVRPDGAVVTYDRLIAAVNAKVGQMAQMQYVTCSIYQVDFKLRELAETANQEDYSKMSDAQKYMTIFDRYANAFGPDFLKMIPFMYSSNAEYDPTKIVHQFKKELWDAIGYDNEKVAAACKAAQYGNMSDTQVRAAIAAKYPPISEITLREFKLMVHEMHNAGVDGGLMNVIYRASETDYNSLINNVPGFHALIMEEHLLNQPLDIQHLKGTYKTMSNAMAKTFYNDVGISNAVMLELFGVGLDGSGNALTRQPGTPSYNTLVQQAASMYSSWTKSDYENWLREQYETERQQWLLDNQQQVKIYEAWLTWESQQGEKAND